MTPLEKSGESNLITQKPRQRESGMTSFAQDLKKDWAKAPNLVTEFRLVLSLAPGALFLFVAHGESTGWLLISALVFLIVVATDMLDGWLARRRNQVTDLGKLLDPLVDKVLIIVTLAAITALNPWVFIPLGVILVREIWVTILRMKARQRGVTVAANRGGKNKMVVQTFAVILLLLPISGMWLILTWAVVLLAIVLTIQSGIAYKRAVELS